MPFSLKVSLNNLLESCAFYPHVPSVVGKIVSVSPDHLHWLYIPFSECNFFIYNVLKRDGRLIPSSRLDCATNLWIVPLWFSSALCRRSDFLTTASFLIRLCLIDLNSYLHKTSNDSWPEYVIRFKVITCRRTQLFPLQWPASTFTTARLPYGVRG